jgi:hypothetical protein
VPAQVFHVDLLTSPFCLCRFPSVDCWPQGSSIDDLCCAKPKNDRTTVLVERCVRVRERERERERKRERKRGERERQRESLSARPPAYLPTCFL